MNRALTSQSIAVEPEGQVLDAGDDEALERRHGDARGEEDARRRASMISEKRFCSSQPRHSTW